MHRQTSKPIWVEMGDRHIEKDVELNVMLRSFESRKFRTHPQGNAMTGVHGYDIHGHSVPIVFHYSVGFDIAYPRMEAMREPKGRDKQDSLDPRFFHCVK